MDAKIELYFDCLSPFSFLAYTVLSRYEQVWNVEVELKPVLLGGLMAATKNVPPGARPWAASTAKVSGQDMERNKAWFNLPHMLGMPANFFGPKGPADPTGLSYIKNPYQRTLAALSLRHPSAVPAASRLVFEAIWANPNTRDSQGNVLMSIELLKTICIRAGLSDAEAAEVMAHINDPETVDQLKSSVAEAVSRGAFGAPFIVVTPLKGAGKTEEQVYFGSDRFEAMAFSLGKPWLGPDPMRPTAGAFASGKL